MEKLHEDTWLERIRKDIKMVTYENMETPIIPNTSMQKYFIDGVHKGYTIRPVAGYVIHDKNRDWPDINPDTTEKTLRRGYTTGEASCHVSYDFAVSTISDENGQTFEAYGAREFAARPVNSVPADQIFGGVENKPEIM